MLTWDFSFLSYYDLDFEVFKKQPLHKNYSKICINYVNEPQFFMVTLEKNNG